MKDEDFHEKSKRVGEAIARWSSNNEKYIEKYLEYLLRLQNRRFLNYELLFSIIGLGIIVNLSSNIIMNIIIGLTTCKGYSINTDAIQLTGLGALAVIFAKIFNNIMKRFDPRPRSLILGVSLQECSQMRDAEIWENIFKYMKEKKMIEFKEYARNFIECFESYLGIIFGGIEPVKLSDNLNYHIFDIKERFPEISRTYDISEISLKNITATLEVNIRPDSFINLGEGIKSHIRDIKIFFRIDVVNKMNPHADDFIEELFWFKLRKIPEYTAICLERGFNRITS